MEQTSECTELQPTLTLLAYLSRKTVEVGYKGLDVRVEKHLVTKPQTQAQPQQTQTQSQQKPPAVVNQGGFSTAPLEKKPESASNKVINESRVNAAVSAVPSEKVPPKTAGRIEENRKRDSAAASNDASSYITTPPPPKQHNLDKQSGIDKSTVSKPPC